MMRTGRAAIRARQTGAGVRPVSLWGICAALLFFAAWAPAAPGTDLEAAVTGLERRYAGVQTIAGEFRQTYRAPGIEQEESGVFRMKRPGLMRWEYRRPEEKMFIADGQDAFLYVPADRQVTVRAFRASDMRGTPLELLLGSADLRKSFAVSWERDFKPAEAESLHLRLIPRGGGEYEFLVLELDPRTFDVRRIVIHEPGGNTSEFVLSNLVRNAKIDSRAFRFNPPKGTEILRLEAE